MSLVREAQAGVWCHPEAASLDSEPREDADLSGSSIRAALA